MSVCVCVRWSCICVCSCATTINCQSMPDPAPLSSSHRIPQVLGSVFHTPVGGEEKQTGRLFTSVCVFSKTFYRSGENRPYFYRFFHLVFKEETFHVLLAGCFLLHQWSFSTLRLCWCVCAHTCTPVCVCGGHC